jgi:hypothetical protein
MLTGGKHQGTFLTGLTKRIVAGSGVMASDSGGIKRGTQIPTARATSHGLTRTRLMRRAAVVLTPRDTAEALKAQQRAKFTGHPVGRFVAQLTKKAFEKHGFSAATLLTDWATIVGRDVAAYTAPERLKWPRGVDAYGDVGEDGEGRPGATLLLRVDSIRVLDVQYKSRQLIERINAYFGYKAVSELRFIQAPVAELLPQPVVRPVRALQPTAAVQAVTDDNLREALAKLEATIAARKKTRK